MGHLRALEESLDAIGLPSRFQTPPTYHWLKEKAKAIQQLKAAVKEGGAGAGGGDTQVYLAADDDREGEMIAYSVCVLLRLPPSKTPRIVFHEITEKAIRHALDHPRTLDMNRVHAQQARAVLDLLIGFTISPLLWKYVAPALSAGRCQTPALRLTIEREREIAGFQSSRSWVLSAQWTPQDQKSPILTTTMADALEDEASALEVLRHARDHPQGTVTDLQIRPWMESAPPPLMTSTLQQQASQLYHFSPKQTMCMAQRLYEAGHITYMRTDHATMAEEAKEQARTWVRATFGEAYVASSSPPSSSTPKKMKRPRAVAVAVAVPKVSAQEAHECIRPTHLDVTELSTAEWGPSERRLYQLISRRALQSVMAPAQGTTTTLTVHMDGLGEDFPWISEEKKTQFEGWKRLGKVASIKEEQEEQEQEEQEKEEKEQKQEQKPSCLVEWTIGTRLTWTHVEGKEKETSPPGRYTEASLVRELERHGIGRPSTFASLLAVLQDKGYARIQDIPATPLTLVQHSLLPCQWPPTQETHQTLRGGEKRKLVPTPLGRSVWEWLEEHLEDLFAYTFTASMEKRLDQIAEGAPSEGAETLLQATWDSYRERYERLKNATAASKAEAGTDTKAQEVVPPPSSLKQKVFKEGIKAVQTKKGPLLLQEGATKDATVFFGWPNTVSWSAMTEKKAREHILAIQQERQGALLGEHDGAPILKKTGQYGPYLQWNTIRIPFVEGEAVEEIVKRIQRKQAPEDEKSQPPCSSSASPSSPSPSSPSILKETTHFQVRTGPYGPYLMKKTETRTHSKQTKTIFVSVPKGLDVALLTDKELAALYQAGCEAKKNRKSYPSKKEKEDVE